MNRETEAFLKAQPKLRERDVREMNGLFPSFLFRRKKTGEVWASCCRRHETLPKDHPIWTEEHVRAPKNGWDTKQAKKHDQTPCPFCGRKGTVKELRYTGRRENLTAWRRVLLLRWERDKLWASAATLEKRYAGMELTAPPKLSPEAVYRFGKKELDVSYHSWYSGFHDLQRYVYAEFGKKTADEPFNWNAQEGSSYAVLGMDALEKSPVRYCRGEEFCRNYDQFVKFLHVAFAYPRQTEMLMKAGMADVVWDLAKRGVKHAAVLDWRETEPRRAWKVPTQALKDFLAQTKEGSRPIGMLELWKKLNRESRVSMEETAEAWPLLERTEVRQAAAKWGVGLWRLWKYLDGQNHCHVSAMFQAWKDYVDLGEKQGLALHRCSVLLPANLGEAHDAAVERRNREWAELRAREEAERKKERARERQILSNYGKYREKLEKKYGWAADGYLILVPQTKEEIEAEGRALKHCVAGYADRHMRGSTVILFMRKEKHPDKPWLTIEMQGEKLKQIHGYMNEGLYTAKGRIAPDPREVYREFLDTWLAWIAAGSRRKKDGTPIVPKTEREKVRVTA